MVESKRTILKEFTFTCERPVGKKEKTFEERSRSILSNVSSFLKRDVRTDGIWKISMDINSSNRLQHMKVVGGVLGYNIEYDVDKFLNHDIGDQKFRMLTLVDETLTEIFRKAELNVERLTGLRDFIIARDYKNIFTGPSSFRNGTDACAICEQEFERANIFLILKKSGREIERIFVLETSPEEFIFNVYLKAPEWVSDVELKLTAANGEGYSVRRLN